MEDVSRQQQRSGRPSSRQSTMSSSSNINNQQQRGGGGGEDGLGDGLSPFSNFSFNGTLSSQGEEHNDASISGTTSASSVGKQSSSSVGGDNRSLQRRAREFENILETEQNALHHAFDSPSRQETEDDDLQVELQDLARSEMLLRKELEIFATSFRKPNTTTSQDDEDMDDASTLPDYGDPALLGSSPRSRLTPGMAPWTPLSDGEQLLSHQQQQQEFRLPTLEQLRRQRLMRTPSSQRSSSMSPELQPQHPQQSPSSAGASPLLRVPNVVSTPAFIEDDDDRIMQEDGVGGLILPASIGGPLISPLRPLFNNNNDGTFASPARVSLDDEVSSSLQQQQQQAVNYLPTTSLYEALDISQSSDDSAFLDLARLSGATPRTSNIKGNPNNEPLHVPSPSSSDAGPGLASSAPLADGDGQPSPSLQTTSSGLWSNPNTPGATPMVAPFYSGYGLSASAGSQGGESTQSPNSSAQSSLPPKKLAPAMVSPSALSHTPLSRSSSGEKPDDKIGLLVDYSGSSWKLAPNNSPPSLYLANTTPFLSATEDDDEVPTPPPGEQSNRNRSKKSRGGFTPSGFMPRRGRQPSSFLHVATLTDSTEPPPRQRRRNRSLILLALLLICGVCVIVIPTSVVLSRNRTRSASSAGIGGGSAVDESTRPSMTPTTFPSVSPSVSGAPSLHPSDSPTASPTVSAQPTYSNKPSVSPTATPQPTSALPSYYPSSLPSRAPTDPPTNLPSDRPLVNPTGKPTMAPSSMESTFVPTHLPTASPSFQPTSPSPSSGLLDDLTLNGLLISASSDGGEALRTVGSPQYLASQWLSQNTNLPTYSDERRIQRYAMATFFFSLGGDSWLQNDGWLTDEDECSWFSRINRGVCGPLINDSLSPLRRLVLYYNNLQGSLPPEIGLLTDLEEIHLVGGPERFISGSVPSELGKLVALKDVQLADNNLTGVIPSSLGAWSEIEILDLSSNALQGPLLDDVAAEWTQLYELNLSSNLLTGNMPQIFAENIEFLDLSRNVFTGAVPASIGIMQDLRILNLDYNRFTSLPTDIISLQSLEDFSAVSNQLRGPILSELGFLPRLRSLSLATNALAGTIPPELGLLSRLTTVLDLSNNLLVGPIPTELGEVNDRLRSLRLAGNQLTGAIPTSLANLGRLAEVRLEENNLSGAVPDTLCRIWDRTLPRAYLDCNEVSCPCCNFCCTDGEGCVCRYASNPDFVWRCF